jgi:hypothetical protein
VPVALMTHGPSALHQRGFFYQSKRWAFASIEWVCEPSGIAPEGI